MTRRSLRYAFGTAAIATGLMAATVPSAHAERSPGVDETFVIDVCPFPIEVHASYQSFNEIFLPHEIQDHRNGYAIELTNLDTGTSWKIQGNPISHFVDNPDGSVTQIVDGVWIAPGPLHTVYFGHWTRTSPDGDFFGIPFAGNGTSVDFCQRLG